MRKLCAKSAHKQEPLTGIEPATSRLLSECSTAKLQWRVVENLQHFFLRDLNTSRWSETSSISAPNRHNFRKLVQAKFFDLSTRLAIAYCPHGIPRENITIAYPPHAISPLRRFSTALVQEEYAKPIYRIREKS